MTAFAFERRDVKTGSIKYADAKREAARLKRVAAEKLSREEKKLAASAAPPPYVRGRTSRASARASTTRSSRTGVNSPRTSGGTRRVGGRRLTRTIPTCWRWRPWTAKGGLRGGVGAPGEAQFAGPEEDRGKKSKSFAKLRGKKKR